MTFKNFVKSLTATADRFKHFWESKRFSFSDNTNIQMWTVRRCDGFCQLFQ